MSRKIKIISLAANIYLVISTLVIMLRNMMSAGPADSSIFGFHGTENLIFYTVDSNILMSLCALGMIIFLLRNRETIPGWFHIVFMAAAVSVGVTFVTVAFFLAPGQAMAGRGYFSLFRNNNLFFHLINPLVGCIDFIFLIPHRKYSIPECLYGVIPTAVYAAVYTIMVVFTKTWMDIYNFTFGGHFELAPIPLITFPLMSFGIAVLLTRLHNHVRRIV